MNRIVTWSATAALALSPLALAAATSQVSASPSPSSSVSAKAKAGSFKVTAKANKEIAVARQDQIKVKGRVSPKAAGQKILLQQRVGKKKTWKGTGTAKIKNNGKYVLKDKPTVAGTREYRVVKPAARGVRKGISKSMTVVVYKWEKLAYKSGPRTNVIFGNVLIGTDGFAASIFTETAGTPASAEFTLGRKCTELRSTYALTDFAESGSTGSIAVSTDGAVRATHNLAIGTVFADQVTDLTDVYRLKFDLSTSATPAGVAAVAEPMVLCTR